MLEAAVVGGVEEEVGLVGDLAAGDPQTAGDLHDGPRLADGASLGQNAVGADGPVPQDEPPRRDPRELDGDPAAQVTVVGARLTGVDIDATTALALGLDGPAWLRARGRTGLLVWAAGRAEVVA